MILNREQLKGACRPFFMTFGAAFLPLTMRQTCVALTAFFLLAFGGCSPSGSDADKTRLAIADNAAFFWNTIALDCTSWDTEVNSPRPTITARALALVHTAMYDAWTVYDSTARPVYLDNVGRLYNITKDLERDKAIAIGYAAGRALETYFPESRRFIIEMMRSQGLDPLNYSLDINTPEGIGNQAAKLVYANRLNDRSNQYNSPAYGDFTGYVPKNTHDNITDSSKWYPKPFYNDKGYPYVVGCLTPHWAWVQPFALDSAWQFRPSPPPAPDSKALKEEVREVVRLQANLTNEEKALVEFMRDGPQSVQQAGHWLVFARHLSKRYNYSVDDDIKMFFVVAMTAHDAFIACWDAKMHYDFARPQALVNYYFPTDTLYGWKGEHNGWGEITGEDWIPYSPSSFVCPPFPSYPSGHSTVSSACSRVLQYFTDSNELDLTIEWQAGSLTEPEITPVPVTLHFPTLDSLAKAAGHSRVFGGYHIPSDNRAGLTLGEQVADQAWKRYWYLVERR